MGKWSRWELGRDLLPSPAFFFGGNTPRSSIERIVGSYERVLFHKHDNYEPFLVEAKGRETLLAFQVYGAPMVADLLHILGDGGVRSSVFLGAAYGIDPDLREADCIVPTRVRCLDGFSPFLGAPDWVPPDPGVRHQLVATLKGAEEPFHEGPTVSVPSTFFHGRQSAIPREALALEIETAAFLFVGAASSIRCAAALVISDTATHTLRDDRVSRDERLVRVFEAIRDMPAEIGTSRFRDG
jgi:uridine phosphorylase